MFEAGKAGRSDKPDGRASLIMGAAATVYVTIGGNFLGFRVAVETIPPFLATMARALVGGLLLLTVWAIGIGRSSARDELKITARQVRSIVVQATFLLVIGQGSVAWSVQQLPAGTAAVLASSMPIWVAMLGLVWFRTRLPLRGLLGVSVGFGGLVLLSQVREGGGNAAGIPLLPEAVTLAGAAGTAAGVLYGQRADLPQNGLLSAALQMIVAGLILGTLSLATGETSGLNLGQISARSWWALAYLIVFGSVVGYSALVWLTRNAPPTVAASFAYVGPIVALILSALLLGEHVGAAKVAASVLALVGAGLMASGGDRNKQTQKR